MIETDPLKAIVGKLVADSAELEGDIIDDISVEAKAPQSLTQAVIIAKPQRRAHVKRGPKLKSPRATPIKVERLSQLKPEPINKPKSKYRLPIKHGMVSKKPLPAYRTVIAPKGLIIGGIRREFGEANSNETIETIVGKIKRR